jgi:uncharacterized phage protein gp47/JayE
MAGLDDTGLTIKTTAEVLAEIETEQRAEISPGLNLSSASVLGQINGIFASKLGELWEVARAVYTAMDPDGSTGASLDRVAALTGTERQAATKSSVTLTVNLDDGFSAAVGDMVVHVTGDPTRRFVNTEAAENSSGITDDFEVAFEAETAGAVPAMAGSLEVIAEPLTGWNSVTNASDAVLGLEADTDSELRVRRRDELAGGSHSADAIRTDILQNEELGVIFCRVLENDTDSTDANGVPRKSIEVIAYGPASPTADDDQALAEQIQASKTTGTRAYGSTTKTVEDDQGNEYSIGLTRPTLISVWLEIDIEVDADTFPADGDDQVIAALVAVGDDNYQPGSDVVAERLKAAAFSVDGVTDVTALRLGTSASPVGTSNIAVAIREIADLDSARVLVTHV